MPGTAPLPQFANLSVNSGDCLFYISRAQVVVFVDAAVDAPREVQLRKLEPGEPLQLMAHAADPRTMLALARDVFGHTPEVWWLTIPIADLNFGETLSPFAEEGSKSAVKKILALHTDLAGY